MRNEVMEKLEIFLQNLRCEDGKRETLVHLQSCQTEAQKLKKQEQRCRLTLKKLDSFEREILEAYIEQIKAVAFEEQQEAYLQGMVDIVQILSGMGILSGSPNVEKIINKIKNGPSE